MSEIKTVTTLWSGSGTAVVSKGNKLYLHYDDGSLAGRPCTREITLEESKRIQSGSVEDLSAVIAIAHKRDQVIRW